MTEPRDDVICRQRRARLRAGSFTTLAVATVLMLGLLMAGCSEDAATTSTVADLSTPEGGRLELKETSYDFGRVPVGEAVTHSFEIRNSGDGPLRLGELEVKRLEGC